MTINDVNNEMLSLKSSSTSVLTMLAVNDSET